MSDSKRSDAVQRGGGDDEFGYDDEFDGAQILHEQTSNQARDLRSATANVKGSMSQREEGEDSGYANAQPAEAGGSGSYRGSSDDGSIAGPGLLGVPPSGSVSWQPGAVLGSLGAGVRGVTPEDLRDILAYITSFTPTPVELPAPLKPFIPDFLPAVFDVDPMIKPGRPDGQRETLGWRRVDEAAPLQSDPTVLDLRLRALSKKSGLKPVPVRSIEHADKNPREITRWADSMAELHRTRPPPTVHYSRPMPDLESLMQEWAPAFEAALKDLPLPSAEQDLSLEEYARVACAVVGIPVYPSPASTGGAAQEGAASGDAAPPPAGNQLVQALHVLLTLYQEFRSNPHFAALQGAGGGVPGGRGGVGLGEIHSGDAVEMPGSPGGSRNRLEIRRAEDEDGKLPY